MRGRFKKWAAPYLDEHDSIVLKSIDPESPFFKGDKLYLEIGSGKGDFVLGMSEIREGNYIALERDLSISGILAKKVVDSGKENIRVVNEDFDVLFDQLKELKFDIIFLNFSDPWPKKKHWKRRLTTRERLTQMASLLKEGGEIRIKTDNVPLYEFTLEEGAETSLKMVSNFPVYEFDGSDDAMSEYERNFRSQGVSIHRVIYKK